MPWHSFALRAFGGVTAHLPRKSPQMTGHGVTRALGITISFVCLRGFVAWWQSPRYLFGAGECCKPTREAGKSHAIRVCSIAPILFQPGAHFRPHRFSIQSVRIDDRNPFAI